MQLAVTRTCDNLDRIEPHRIEPNLLPGIQTCWDEDTHPFWPPAFRVQCCAVVVALVHRMPWSIIEQCLNVMERHHGQAFVLCRHTKPRTETA